MVGGIFSTIWIKFSHPLTCFLPLVLEKEWIENIKKNIPELPDEKKARFVKEYSLSNYPNPFNLSTNISFSIQKESYISLVIYDVNGNNIMSLVNEYKTAGKYRINWNGKNEKGIPVSGGVYFYSIEAGECRQTKKMVLLK